MLTVLITIPLAAALATIAASRTRLPFIAATSVVTTLASFGAALVLLAQPALRSAPGPLFLDALGMLLALIITFVGCAAAVYAVGYLNAEMQKGIIGPRRVWQFWILFHLFLFAMLLAVTAKNPVVTWAAIEATTLATVFLVSFYSKQSSLEAGWKYLVVNSLGLLVAFFGTLTMLAAGGEVTDGFVWSWSDLTAHAGVLSPLAVKIAFTFILVGYGTKVGLAPMHTWLPDAHGKAPAPVSALLSGVLLATAFVPLARYTAVANRALGEPWGSNLLLIFGCLSVALMGFMLLTQYRYKRMLAYSSIEHMGIVAVGFALGGAGALYALIHLLYHALIKSALFLTSGNFFLAYSTGKVRGVRGALTTLPWSGPLFLAGILAVLGMPPFGTFMTKLGIVTAAMHVHPVVAIVLIITFALVFIGMVLHVSGMLFGEPPSGGDAALVVQGEWSILTVAPIAVLLGCALVLAVFVPLSLQEVISRAALLAGSGAAALPSL